MLKLHVFLVDTGIMYTFDMEMALESVSKLMEAIAMVTQIPVSKQVLLATNGDPLNPVSRVGSYKSAGTETNPIFLFSKSAIESPQPPLSSSTFGSAEASLDDQVDKCLQMPPTYDTLVVRAKLASEFHLCARELGELCENLVGDQQLQQQGWLAVVSNLDNITRALNAHGQVFKHQYTNFLQTQKHYLDMLERFDNVISLLSRIPVLSCLLKKNSIEEESEPMALLEWVTSKEQKTSLHTLVAQCKELLSQFDETVPQRLIEEIDRVLDSSDNLSMKEIKGLNERLVSLQQRLSIAQQFVQDQADMAQGFKQNQMRAEHLGDPSVLPDLCASHKKQLLVLLKNHRQLRDICSLCTKAKDELSANLHARLRWVMYIEHSICNCDSKLLAFHESLKKMRRRLEVFEQVFEAPRMYILAVLEILRRKSFSTQFLEWGRSVSISSAEACHEEIEKRSKFSDVFGSHFLQSLFVGLDDRPSIFAESPPSIFDERLPEVGVNDIRLLQQKVPELLIELSLGDSLEQSVYVRERLSQTNLSKLVDPRSNPSLEETLKLRARTGINSMPKMTVSQLQKEISQEDIPLDMTQKDLNWQLGESVGDITDADFEPSSLKTLHCGMDALHSSQSSDVSDSMFRSAEGLDDELPTKEKADASTEMVGILELPEGALGHNAECLTTEVVDGGFENISKSTARPIPLKRSPRDKTNASTASSSIVDGFAKAVAGNLADSPFISVASPLFRESVANLMQSSRHLRVEFQDLVKFVDAQLKNYQEICRYFHKNVAEIFANWDAKNRKLEDVSNENEELKNDIMRLKEEVEKTSCAKEDIENIKDSLKRCHIEEINTLQFRHKDELQRVENHLSREIESLRAELMEVNESSAETVSKNQLQWESRENGYKETIEDLESSRTILEINMVELKTDLDNMRLLNRQLESENQEKFNLALKKVKLEKDKQLKELQNSMDVMKDQLVLKDENLEQLRAEVKHYETINASILTRLETLENDNEVKEEKMKDELNKIRNGFEIEKNRLMEEFQEERDEFSEKLESEKIERKSELHSLMKKFDAEKSELQNDYEKEKAIIIDRFAEEKKEMLENFTKEKSALLLSCELEKQKFSEDFEKQQSLSQTSSIEEGIDALEWEKLLQKLRDSEMENKRLQEKLASNDFSNDIKMDDEDMLNSIKEKEDENAMLREDLKRLTEQMEKSSMFNLHENISFKQLKVNDLVLLCYDEHRSNYVVLSSEETKYFLHPDSLEAMQMKSGGVTQKREWFLAYITNQEYCIAKKVNNRFKLPVGTYFYRIHIKPAA